jgi:hypothetical protein
MDCYTMDECIAPCGVYYIGGRDPYRAGGQGGGIQGRRLQWRRHLGEAASPETLMGCLSCNPNGPTARRRRPGEAATLMGMQHLYRIGGAGPSVLYNIV